MTAATGFIGVTSSSSLAISMRARGALLPATLAAVLLGAAVPVLTTRAAAVAPAATAVPADLPARGTAGFAGGGTGGLAASVAGSSGMGAPAVSVAASLRIPS